jgi:ribosome-binding factor A
LAKKMKMNICPDLTFYWTSGERRLNVARSG